MAGFNPTSLCKTLQHAYGPVLRRLYGHARQTGHQLWWAMEAVGQRRAAARLGVAAARQWPHDPALAWDLRRRAARCRAAARSPHGVAVERH